MRQLLTFLKHLIFRRIYIDAFEEAASLAVDYRKWNTPETGFRLDSGAHRANLARIAISAEVENLIRERAYYWRKKKLWPIEVCWRWQERDYTRRYRQMVHACDGSDKSRNTGWVLHLWAVKIVFG